MNNDRITYKIEMSNVRQRILGPLGVTYGPFRLSSAERVEIGRKFYDCLYEKLEIFKISVNFNKIFKYFYYFLKFSCFTGK